MKVTFRKIVGFPATPVHYGCEIDTRSMARDEVETLRKLMKRVDLAELCRHRPAQGADAPQYELTVTSRQGQQQARFSELDLMRGSAGLAALVDFLSERAQILPRA